SPKSARRATRSSRRWLGPVVPTGPNANQYPPEAPVFPVGGTPLHPPITFSDDVRTSCDFFGRQVWVFRPSVVTIESRSQAIKEPDAQRASRIVTESYFNGTWSN